MIDVAINCTRLIDARKESLWVLCNAITGCEDELKVSMLQISEYQILNVLVIGCRIQCEQRLIKNILEAIDAMLDLDAT
jgi:hypothetical protein